jgi:hypothetical protein
MSVLSSALSSASAIQTFMSAEPKNSSVELNIKTLKTLFAARSKSHRPNTATASEHKPKKYTSSARISHISNHRSDVHRP